MSRAIGYGGTPGSVVSLLHVLTNAARDKDEACPMTVP